MRLPFANSFSRFQQARRLTGVVILGIGVLMWVVGMVAWNGMRAHPKIFVWYWTAVFLDVCAVCLLVVWDLLDVARLAAREREKMAREHFSDPEFLRRLREEAAKHKEKKD